MQKGHGVNSSIHYILYITFGPLIIQFLMIKKMLLEVKSHVLIGFSMCKLVPGIVNQALYVFISL